MPGTRPCTQQIPAGATGSDLRLVLLSFFLTLLIIAVGLLAALGLLDRGGIAEELRRRLVTAAGPALAIDGEIELSLLPRPSIGAGRIGWAGTIQGIGDVALAAERLELRLALRPLLQGELVVARIDVFEPTLRLDRNGPADRAALARAWQGAVPPVAQVNLVGGRILLAGGRGPATALVEALALEIDNNPKTGAVELRAGGRAGQVPFRLDMLGNVAGAPRALPLRASLQAGGELLRLDLDGTLTGADAGAPRLAGRVEARVTDLARLLGAVRGPPFAFEAGVVAPAGLAGSLQAQLAAGPTSLALSGLELRLGDTPWRGSGHLGEAGPGSLALELETPRLALDGIATDGWTIADARVRELGRRRGPVRLRIGEAIWRGQPIRRVRLEATLTGDGAATIGQLGLEAPGNAALQITGTASLDPTAPAFQGRGRLAVEDLRASLAWLGVELGQLPEGRLRTLQLEAAIGLEPAALRLDAATLRLDATRGTGALAIAGGPAIRIALRGELDRLALDAYLPDRAALEQLLAAADRPDLPELAVDLAIERLGLRGAELQTVRLAAGLAGGIVAIEELAVGDLDGTRLRVVGTASAARRSAELALDAAIGSPARLARRLAPVLGLPEPPATLADLDAVSLSGTISTAAGRLEAEAEARGGAWRGEGSVRRGPDGGAALLAKLDTTELRLALDAALTRGAARPKLSGTVALEGVQWRHVDGLYRMLEAELGLPAGPATGWPGSWPRARLAALPDGVPDLALDLLLPQGRLSLARDGGTLRLATEGLPLDDGRIAGSLALDEGAPAPAASVRLALRSIAADRLLRSLRAGGGIGGRVDLDLNATSRGASLAELVAGLAGSAQVRLVDAQMSAAALPAAGELPGTRLPVALLEGGLTIEGGIAAAVEPLVLDVGGRRLEVDGRFDLLAWILEATVRGESGAARRLIGPPDRLRALDAP